MVTRLQDGAHRHSRIPGGVPADRVAVGLFRHALTTARGHRNRRLDKRQDAFYLVHLSAVCWAYRCEPTAQAHAPIRAISNDNRPQLSAVASPLAGQHLCCAKIIVTAAIKGQDKLQLFSCLSKRQERERFFHGCNIVCHCSGSHVGLKSYMASTCDQARAASSTSRIRLAYAQTSMSKSAWRTQWIPRFICRMSGLGPNGLFFVVNDRVRKLFPLRCGSV